MAKTQKQLILEQLHRGPVCAGLIYVDNRVTHRLAARIHELRRAGYRIETRPCSSRWHQHKTRTVEYRLEEDA